MSDKIQKFLAKLTDNELGRVSYVLQKLQTNDTTGLKVKAIGGKKDFYRVRVGRIRIIYQSTGPKTKIIHITNRNEKTYRDL